MITEIDLNMCRQIKDVWGFTMTGRHKLYAELLTKYSTFDFEPQIVRKNNKKWNNFTLDAVSKTDFGINILFYFGLKKHKIYCKISRCSVFCSLVAERLSWTKIFQIWFGIFLFGMDFGCFHRNSFALYFQVEALDAFAQLPFGHLPSCITDGFEFFSHQGFWKWLDLDFGIFLKA